MEDTQDNSRSLASTVIIITQEKHGGRKSHTNTDCYLQQKSQAERFLFAESSCNWLARGECVGYIFKMGKSDVTPLLKMQVGCYWTDQMVFFWNFLASL